MTASTADRLTRRHLMDWGVLLLGIDSTLPSSASLSEEEIRQEAELALLRASEHASFLDLLVDLSSPRSDREMTRAALEQMCEFEHVDLSKSRRKLRAASLENLLELLPSDPIYGLVEISRFWIEWGAADSPHEIQGVGNEVSAVDYYTETRFSAALAKNKAWLEQEYELLSSTQ
jgi:Uncharacterized protein conserved in bacteria (DUF2247)